LGHANRSWFHDAIGLDAQSRRLCLSFARRCESYTYTDGVAQCYSYSYCHGYSNRHTDGNSDTDTETYTQAYTVAEAASYAAAATIARS
jgi:hypothetical protein